MKQINMAKILILLLLITNAFDVYATANAIQIGYEEANPIAWWVIENAGYTGLMTIKLTLILMLFIAIKYIAGVYLVLLAFATGAYSLLAVIHMLHM